MNAIISARILAHVASGMTLQQAIDAVLGAGCYANLVADVYNTLRARAAN